jgi:hypothetical protein
VVDIRVTVDTYAHLYLLQVHLRGAVSSEGARLVEISPPPLLDSITADSVGLDLAQDTDVIVLDWSPVTGHNGLTSD